MLSLNAELLSHLFEAGRRGVIVILGGFAVDHNASGGESRPQRQPRGADKRRLKPRCQIERELHSLFAVALDVDVDQYRRNGHHLLPLVQPAAFFESCPRDRDRGSTPVPGIAGPAFHVPGSI
jgi:hypothetical protein